MSPFNSPTKPGQKSHSRASPQVSPSEIPRECCTYQAPAIILIRERSAKHG